MHADSHFLKQDISAAGPLKVGSVLFSEGTYQIEIYDPKAKATFWPFLQMDDAGKVLDCFCTCKAAEKKKSCPHLAAAYLRIFNKKREPLHIRFRQSLWNHLCQMASRRHGYDTKVLKGDASSGYEASSATGKRLFFAKPLNEEGRRKIVEITEQRPPETEETSLKFSNLSSEELTLWRENRPSHQLQYELSFWSDLAKWWMHMQEAGAKYQITFTYQKDPLPKWIKIHFNAVDAEFYIAEANWSSLIPSLATVESPLPVHEFQQQAIKSIKYLPDAKEFHIDFVSLAGKQEWEPSPLENKKIVEVGEWAFVPKEGFYPARVDPLLKEKVIPQRRIASLLQHHTKVLEKYLTQDKIHTGGIKARYRLYFDAEENLHILCYVFEPGDLQKAHSAYFGPWAYVEGKGFYLLENLLFEGIEKVIPRNEVSDFVSRHRIWLHAYEGFQTHLFAVESLLTYSVTPEKYLHFEARFEEGAEKGEVVDLGEWIYVKGRGFYSKITGRSGIVLRPGMRIASHDVSRFIKAHKEELEHIKGFFSPRSPLEKSGLNISIDEDEKIVVRPEIIFLPAYASANIQFFGDYLYVEGEGFSEIPAEFRLPDPYVKETVITEIAEPFFVNYELETLRPFVITLDPRLAKPKELYLKIDQIRRDKKSQAGRWIIDLKYETDLGSVDAVEAWRAINDQKTFLFSTAGMLSLKVPRFNWLKGINKRRWLKNGKQVRLTTLELMRLSVFEDIREPSGDSADAVDSRKVLEELRTFQTPEHIDLEGLQSNLRTYQEFGVKWLWFLYCHGLSGLLCDEMGLGKTHQAMALIAAAMNADKERKNKYLVVCPTSVIYHWEELLKRFLPSIKVGVFYGAQRTLEGDYELLLTSYGTLRSEKKALSMLPFEVAIFDELQIAKNVHSQTHKALRTMDAKVRIGLTGTPIENRLLELKALFDIVLPSYFPNEAAFKEHFVNPIEKSQDPEKKALLARLIKPFIMRRKKTEVLQELPEKIEEIAYCDLSPEQKELYNKTYLSHRESLIQELSDENKPVPYIHIFSLLSNLKQICDHPCLVLKDISEFHKHHSGKWELFMELLQEVRDSGQKLVVFSQYLLMLDIIEAYLTEKNIGFAGIRGSTRNRKVQLDKFRQDPKCEVFVASLQAAGVGIDLVSASVVIHYDRWWNPAKENQATDRVHRIGQSRGVQVFKMVTKNTIEEHIHRLIEKKMQLMEGVIGFDEQDQIKGLDRQELVQLLQLLQYDVEENKE